MTGGLFPFVNISVKRKKKKKRKITSQSDLVSPSVFEEETRHTYIATMKSRSRYKDEFISRNRNARSLYLSSTPIDINLKLNPIPSHRIQCRLEYRKLHFQFWGRKKIERRVFFFFFFNLATFTSVYESYVLTIRGFDLLLSRCAAQWIAPGIRSPADRSSWQVNKTELGTEEGDGGRGSRRKLKLTEYNLIEKDTRSYEKPIDDALRSWCHAT